MNVSLTKKEKEYIVDKVVEILKSPQKEELITQLREKVLVDDEQDDGQTTADQSTDEVIYAVIQAIQELYG
jgi:hypothetical protein